MNQTTPGAIRNALTTIEAQLLKHMEAGGKLEAIKHLYMGSQAMISGSDAYPALMIIPKSGSVESYSTAGYMGSVILTLAMEFQLVAPKLRMADDNINAMARNVLFDSSGNGVIAIMENLLFGMLFSDAVASADTYTPGVNLPLQDLVGQSFRFVEDTDFVYLVSDVTIRLKATYPELSGS